MLTITSPGDETTDRSVTLEGTYADAARLAPRGGMIEIDDNGEKIGTARVAVDGTWSSDIVLASLGANSLTATATDRAGRTGTSDPVAITLDTVLSPPSSGSGGSQTQNLMPAATETIRHADTGHDTFVFRPHPGHVTIEGFATQGRGQDHLSFSLASFTSFIEVLHRTTMQGGDAVIHISPTDSVTLAGVSKAELWADRHTFRFHA